MGKVKFTVDNQEPDVELKSESELNSRPNIKDVFGTIKGTTTSIEIDSHILQDKVESVYREFIGAVKHLPEIDKKVKINTINFSIGIDSSGEVSIWSVFSSNIKSKSSIEVSISFQDQ